MSPHDLRTEHQVDPLAVATARPTFSWKLRDVSATPARQTAYRVLVASSPDRLVENHADCWNSGWVESDRTWNVRYNGAALAAGETYHWLVESWTDSALAPSRSGPARFGVGLLEENQWHARWIALSDDAGVPIGRHFHVQAMTERDLAPWHAITPERRASVRARGGFDLSEPPMSAEVHLCGLGHYRLWCNGQRVGTDELQPAWSDYDRRCYTNTYDVTSLLRRGPNVFAVLLGNGFFNAIGGPRRYAKLHVSFGAPKLRLQARLRFADGRERLVISDATWRVSPGATTFNCIYGGEDFDARLHDATWIQTVFDDSAWAAGKLTAAPAGQLLPQSSAPLRRTTRHVGRALGEIRRGVLVYDLGQNHAGMPELTATGAAGAQVKLLPGESLTTDGLVDQGSASGPDSKGQTVFTYTLRGHGEKETWSPDFSYYGYRYVQAELSAPADQPLPTIDSLASWELQSSLATVGTWQSSESLVDRVRQLVLAAARSNLQHVLTDCPHREKLGWLEVAYLMGPSLAFNFDLRAFLRKMLDDIADAQQPDGLIPGHAPEYSLFEGGFRDSPEWGSAIFHLTALAHQWYGDDEPARRHYGAMCRYLDYLLARRRDGLLLHGLSDWMDAAPPDGSLPGACQLTSAGLTATATLIRNLRALARLAPIAGHEADVARWAALAEETRVAFNRRFFDAVNSTYDTGSPTALALPLALDLVEPAHVAAVARNLRERITRDGFHIRTGDIGHVYVIEALARHGGNVLLWQMVTRDTPPSYGGMIAAGATTLTEDWNADRRLSLNHLMLGHIEQWFYQQLAGFRPDLGSPAWREVLIRPWFPPGMERLAAEHDSPHGTFAISWQREAAKHVRVELRVPPNTRAQFTPPDGHRIVSLAGPRDFPAAPELTLPSGTWKILLHGTNP